MRRALKIAGLVLALLVVTAVVAAAQGSRETYDGPRTSAPAWARPCFTRTPRHDRTLLHRCGRVRGRVLHVGRSYTNELHLLILADWRLMIAKLDDDAHPPSVGSMTTFVGPLVRTSYHLTEVQTFAFH